MHTSHVSCNWPSKLCILIFFFFFERERERERVRASRGGAEREGDTEPKTGSGLWAVSTERDAGLKPTDHETTTWPKLSRSINWATQAPQNFLFEDLKLEAKLVIHITWLLKTYFICWLIFPVTKLFTAKCFCIKEVPPIIRLDNDQH